MKKILLRKEAEPLCIEGMWSGDAGVTFVGGGGCFTLVSKLRSQKMLCMLRKVISHVLGISVKPENRIIMRLNRAK